MDIKKFKLSKKIHAEIIKNSQISDSTWIISEPGNYSLDHNIDFSANTQSAAILITANDVNLNLKGHTINYSGSAQFAVAIIIIPSLNNIKISNGIITNFTGGGLIAIACENIILSDILIDKTNNAAADNATILVSIYILLCKTTKIIRCKITNSTINTGSLSGFLFFACDDILIDNSKSSNILNKGGTAGGFHIVASNNINIKNVRYPKILRHSLIIRN